MSFVSFEFIAFVAIAVFCYYVLPIKKQWHILFFFNIVFYLKFSWKAFLILLISVFITYIAGIIINIKKSKLVLIASIFMIISFLVILKYNGLFSISENSENFLQRYSIIVPLGISFYSLSLISYIVDVYKGKTVETSFAKLLTFVMFFPHILQGPIARYEKIGKEFWEKHVFDYNQTIIALELILWGYIKKMVVADRAAIFVDNVYSNVVSTGGTELFIASVFYSIQIYADFSGCVDIARGVAALFGIELSLNFQEPYFSSSIKEFWRRWHISLGTWYTDYIYIPLGGNRKGKLRKNINVLFVFLISGFWHGVGLNFVIWGLLHGFYQILESFTLPIIDKILEKLHLKKISKHVKIVFTFMLVNFAWIVFRITDLNSIVIIIKKIFLQPNLWVLFNEGLYSYGISRRTMCVLLMFIALMIYVDRRNNEGTYLRDIVADEELILRWIIWITGLVSLVLFGVYGVGYDSEGFIYMQF